MSRSLSQFFWKLADYGFMQGTITTAVYGWILTAEHAQELFANSIVLRILATIVSIAITIHHLMLVYHSYQRSHSLFGQLTELKYAPAERYRPLTISKSFSAFYGAVFTIAMLGLVIIIWMLPTLIPVKTT